MVCGDGTGALDLGLSLVMEILIDRNFDVRFFGSRAHWGCSVYLTFLPNESRRALPGPAKEPEVPWILPFAAAQFIWSIVR